MCVAISLSSFFSAERNSLVWRLHTQQQLAGNLHHTEQHQAEPNAQQPEQDRRVPAQPNQPGIEQLKLQPTPASALRARAAAEPALQVAIERAHTSLK